MRLSSAGVASLAPLLLLLASAPAPSSAQRLSTGASDWYMRFHDFDDLVRGVDKLKNKDTNNNNSNNRHNNDNSNNSNNRHDNSNNSNNRHDNSNYSKCNSNSKDKQQQQEQSNP